MASSTKHVWMAMDPETRRVLVQEREFRAEDFPPGPRGRDWPRREADVDKGLFTKVVNGSTDAPGLPSSDRLHRDWWDLARPEGAPLWPQLPADLSR